MLQDLSVTQDPADRRRAITDSYDGYVHAFERLGELMRTTGEPMSAGMLLDVAGEAGVTVGSVVLDAGCRDGAWPARLEARFGCRVLGVDLARKRLREAQEHHGLAVGEADVAALPIASEAVDFVWCREVLSAVDDPAQCLLEFSRVLRPGGAVIFWEAFPTSALSEDERASLFAALDAPAWWAKGRVAFDTAIQQAGLRIELDTPVAPESTEWLALHQPDNVIESLVTVAKMRRERVRYEAELGPWYERMLAWELWPLYLILGKLQTYALVLRPSEEQLRR